MIQIDMKMPKDCYHCPCHKHWDIHNYICGITGDTANYLGFRRDFCPLKEVSNEPVLDQIRAEIEPTRKMYLEMNDIDWLNGCDYVLSVIDKYKAEQE